MNKHKTELTKKTKNNQVRLIGHLIDPTHTEHTEGKVRNIAVKKKHKKKEKEKTENQNT
jgi:hypothetical protein